MIKDNLFFYIIGTHCCGKTSIINRLKSEGHIELSGSEIGKDLYYKEKFLTSSQDLHFEHRVAGLELDRDKSFDDFQGIVVVETWHPGNIAYALLRNKDGCGDLLEYYKSSPFKKNAIGIWLVLSNPAETINQRTKTFIGDKDWAVEFYCAIQNSINDAVNMMGLKNSIIKISADDDADTVYKSVLDTIKAAKLSNHNYEYTDSHTIV
jgi:hypothetical protein